MNVLWIVNGILPQIGECMGLPYGGDIGWISSIIEEIAAKADIKLGVAFPQKEAFETIEGMWKNVHCFGFYRKGKPWKENPKVKNSFISIYEKFQPDVIEIWGTEFAHSLDAYKAAEEKNLQRRTLVYIQGLISVCSEQYFADLSPKICRSTTIRDFIRKSNIKQEQKKFENRGVNEKKLLQSAINVIGRTDWDYAHVKCINPKIRYFCCRESMRHIFFENMWIYSECRKNTIFVSQGNYPIKGIHYLLKAITYVKIFFPKVNVIIAGENVILDKNKRIYESSYGKYLRKLIEKNEL